MKNKFRIHDLRQVTLFIGAYGSGKSEISANFAAYLAQSGRRVTLCDLDMINPYFRTSDAAQAMQKLGVKLICPQFAGTNADVPAMPAAVHGVFDQPQTHAVLDIGGEDLGARVIASLAPRLMESEKAMYMVVNALRPDTSSLPKILEQARALQNAARLPIDGLVQNTNLLESSRAEEIEASDALIDAAAAKLGVPVVFAAARPQAIPRRWLEQARPLLVLERYIRYPTMSDDRLPW